MTTEAATVPVAGSRLRRLVGAVGLAVALAFVITVVTADGTSTATGRLGGDYPAFYVSGRIAAAGDWEELYDPARLEAEQGQRELLGDEAAGYIAFPYAPYVAAVYRPLSALPYRLSYVIHTALMAGALVAAMVLLRRWLPVVDRNLGVVVVAGLTFFPMFRSVTGGQNTALSLLLLIGAWLLVDRNRDVLAGVALAVLAYKPQLAVPALALFLVRGHWRTLVGFVPGVAAVWAVNAALAGAGWVSWWLEAVGDWAELEAEFNAANTISLPGVAETVLEQGSAAAFVVGWTLAGLVGLATAALWWRWKGRDLAVPMGVAAAALVLTSPHAVYYEAGLLVLTGLVALDRGEARYRPWVAGLWAAGFLHGLNDAIGVSPLFAVTVVAFGLAVAVAVARLRAQPAVAA